MKYHGSCCVQCHTGTAVEIVSGRGIVLHFYLCNIKSLSPTSFLIVTLHHVL